jgi:hypothetical protein
LSQKDDHKLVKIINLLENHISQELWNLDQKDEDLRIFSKNKNKLKIDKTTRVLLIFIVTDKITLPRALVPKYLSIFHDQVGHFGIDRVCHHLRNVFGPQKRMISLTM